jgi:hypothetical protein
VALRQHKEETAATGECRECQTFCDKLVEPRGCLELRCRYLYSYFDEPTGMTGDPLPQCQFKIEPAYEGDGPDFECVNPRFFDCTDAGSEGLRVFDLRDALA